MSLPIDPSQRKSIPVMTGFMDYFPNAVAMVAYVSKLGNDQHNPGQPLHWSRGKSGDHADACLRHLMERGKIDVDGLPHSAKAAWRAMANLEEELEAQGAERARGAWNDEENSEPNFGAFVGDDGMFFDSGASGDPGSVPVYSGPVEREVSRPRVPGGGAYSPDFPTPSSSGALGRPGDLQSVYLERLLQRLGESGRAEARGDRGSRGGGDREAFPEVVSRGENATHSR